MVVEELSSISEKCWGSTLTTNLCDIGLKKNSSMPSAFYEKIGLYAKLFAYEESSLLYQPA